MNFKQWLSEAMDFPRPADLESFLDYASAFCIRVHQSMTSNPIAHTIRDLSDLLQQIQKNIQAEPEDQKFTGLGTPSLHPNQYPHKYPDFKSLIKGLRSVASHYLVEKHFSVPLSSLLDQIEKSALQSN